MQPGNLKSEKAGPFLNKRIVTFFIRLFILFTLWFVCYSLILGPSRVIDRPLTNFITSSVVWCINFLSPSTSPISWMEASQVAGHTYLVQNGQSVFGIYDVCNGIDLMFIYIGIIALLPYPAKRKLIFSILGIIAIILANIIRVCSLYFIYVYQRSAFDFSHHYLFTILMYVLIFYGWMLFIRKGKKI